jgi:hypothetical protein
MIPLYSCSASHTVLWPNFYTFKEPRNRFLGFFKVIKFVLCTVLADKWAGRSLLGEACVGLNAQGLIQLPCPFQHPVLLCKALTKNSIARLSVIKQPFEKSVWQKMG